MPRFRKMRAFLAPTKRWVEPGIQLNARLAAGWSALAHRLLLYWQWGIAPQPEHFDHHIDLHYAWQARRESFWVERGVFASLCLDGGDVLELCCGDGFDTRNFYSRRARRILACDFDPRAIATARMKNRATNVEYVLADIRTSMPTGHFGTVIWNNAIEHFTPAEIDDVLRNVKERMAPRAVLSGSAVVQMSPNALGRYHEYEFADKQDLLGLFQRHFKHVRVFETKYRLRHNLYFWASDGVVPFDPEWSSQVSTLNLNGRDELAKHS